MEIICLSAKNPKTKEIFKEITAGKTYRMIERVQGGYIRILNDLNRALNYPSTCFNIPKKISKGIKQCSKCNVKFIGKNKFCRKCA